MILSATEVAGVFVIDVERVEDERGFFARTFSEQEMRQAGLTVRIAQCSISWNRARGTLRGLHYQAAPHEETKYVRCTRGAIWDVAVDLRRDSATSGRWVGVELNAANQRTLYIPPGVAHGFIALTDDTEVFYQIDVPYSAESSRGVLWSDPQLAIEWPLEPVVISDRDRTLPFWGR